jgi:hypothetical protein
MRWARGKLVLEVNGQSATWDACRRRWGPVEGEAYNDPHRKSKQRWPEPAVHEPGYDLGEVRFVPAPARGGYDTDHFEQAELRVKGARSTRLAARGAPSPRSMELLAFGGGALMVWGGWRKLSTTTYGSVGDGALCDSRTGRWRPMAAKGAPSPRFLPAAAWTGKKLIVWGGGTADFPGREPRMLSDGAVFDPGTNSWKPMPPEGGPPPRFKPVTVWTGRVFLIAGGGPELNSGGARGVDDAWVYDPAANAWSPVANPPRLPEAFWWVRVYRNCLAPLNLQAMQQVLDLLG